MAGAASLPSDHLEVDQLQRLGAVTTAMDLVRKTGDYDVDVLNLLRVADYISTGLIPEPPFVSDTVVDIPPKVADDRAYL